MTSTRLLVFVFSLVAIGCNARQVSKKESNDQGNSTGNPISRSQTPQEVVDQLNSASKAKDWDTWVSCLSSQGELQICGTIMNMRPISQVANGPVPSHLNLSDSEARKLKTWARKLNGLLRKYGISSSTDVRAAKRKLITMKNRSALVREFIDCVFDADAPKNLVGDGWPFSAQIQIVEEFVMDGSYAESKFKVLNDDNETLHPISLKKVNGQWRIAQLGKGGVARY